MEQLQPGGPAAGASGQRGGSLRCQRLAEESDEQLFDLPRPESQVVAGYLAQSAGDPKPWDVDAGLAP